MMKNLRVSSVIVATILMVSCGADGQDSGATTIETVPANGKVVNIQALDNSFRPYDFEIAAGTEVMFDNRGRNDHNILPDTIKDDAGLTALLASDTSTTAWGVASTDFVPGDTYSHLFKAFITTIVPSTALQALECMGLSRSREVRSIKK